MYTNPLTPTPRHLPCPTRPRTHPRQGAAMLYVDIVRPFLLGAMKKATELPALEPYATQFLPRKVGRATGGTPFFSTA